MPEAPDRFEYDDQFRKDEVDRELYPKPDSPPDAQEIVSPSLVTIEWPSFDLQSNEYGRVATEAYVKYMTQGGPKTFQAKVSTEQGGYFACDYSIGNVKDTWDYHGPMTLLVEGTFQDEPVGDAELGPVLEASFQVGGYDETNTQAQAHEDLLQKLSYRVALTLKNFRTSTILVPHQGKLASMQDRDFIRAVLKARPQVYIHWRD